MGESAIRSRPAMPDENADDESRRQFAEYVLNTVVVAMRCLSSPSDPQTLVTKAASMHEFDALTLKVAEKVLPDQWSQIENLAVTFGQNAIPRLYQGRDQRLCALFLVTQGLGQVPELLMTMQAICRHDVRRYNTVMATLTDGELYKLAGHAIRRK